MSVNDVINSNAAAVGAAAPLVYAAARAAQPGALIISSSAQKTSSTGFSQPISDAAKAGMALLGDPNMLFIDTGPTGENWVPDALLPVWYTGSTNHVNDAGMMGYGYRMAESLLRAIQRKFGI